MMIMHRFDSWFISTASKIDEFIRFIDRWISGTRVIEKFHGRSLFAFVLPLPIYFFLVYGPSLASDSAGTVWRGWVAALFVGIAIIVQLWYFFQDKYHRMAWLHFGFIFVIAGATWLLAGNAKEASGGIYRHYFLILAPIAISIAVPLAWILVNRVEYFRIPKEVTDKFSRWFDASKMVDQENSQLTKSRNLFGAVIVSIFRTPLEIITPGAITVIFASAEHMVFWGIFATSISLVLFILSNYDPNQDSFVRITRHLLFTGGTLLVSLAVIILALLRISGLDYVTTMLNASSKWIILSYIASTYAILWLYDFWIDQATLYLLDNGSWDTRKHSSEMALHGGGRIVVAQKGSAENVRMFEPIAFLKRIIQIAPPDSQKELQEEVAYIEQRFQAFSYFCFALFAVILIAIGWHLHTLKQEPEFEKSPDPIQDSNKVFKLKDKLIPLNNDPVILLAASGGGTRAALYTTAVLHGLARLDKINNVVLASGVSGGSAALAYFAINKQSLVKDNDALWQKMLETLSKPFIDDVLTGAAEWRIASGTRLGKLLTESFEQRFAKGNDAAKRTTFGEIDDVGLILNTTLCGDSPPIESLRKKESAMKAGGRLVITNLRSQFDMNKNKESGQNGWKLDLPFEVVQVPSISLFAGASLSANFPPVFSNASIEVGDKRYWVTDGGAVENRGVIALLFALIDELETIQDEMKQSRMEKKNLAEIRIIVADASAFNPDYTSDRGVGAKLEASSKIANRLIKELIARASSLHSSISGRKNGLRVVNLPMPDAMRASGTFGTHWKMPDTIVLQDPFSGSNKGVELNKIEILWIIDAMFSGKYSESSIHEKWPELDASFVMEMTKKQWAALQDGVK
ncbi:MAG: patatin-like phospholipase family protein [Proteobacteria bacterium]|nr:patatin-like phospholipase family protein [Pseudomonadota bacterium]